MPHRADLPVDHSPPILATLNLQSSVAIMLIPLSSQPGYLGPDHWLPRCHPFGLGDSTLIQGQTYQGRVVHSLPWPGWHDQQPQRSGKDALFSTLFMAQWAPLLLWWFSVIHWPLWSSHRTLLLAPTLLTSSASTLLTNTSKTLSWQSDQRIQCLEHGSHWAPAAGSSGSPGCHNKAMPCLYIATSCDLYWRRVPSRDSGHYVDTNII